MKRKNWLWLGAGFLLMTAVLAACQPEPQVVEVTRVVTETVVETVEVEGEAVEVTRVVTETVVETVVTEAEEEAEDEAFEDAQQIQPGGNTHLATGSEEDAVPLPTPVVGPKVQATRTAVEVALINDVPDGVRVEAGLFNEDTVDIPPLQAGEVDDNENWEAYQAYLSAYVAADVIPIDVSERHEIQVIGPQGNPVLDAHLRILAGETEVTTLRTHSDGTVLFFPAAYDVQGDVYTVEAMVNDDVFSTTIPRDTAVNQWQIVHPTAASPEANRLDVLILIDTTGSMNDEINELKQNINAIALQIGNLPAQPDLRVGMVTYRDWDDDYLTRLYEFTASIEVFAENLAVVDASGGGDYPEDLNSGLSQAIHDLSWRSEETVRLIFLVADAPPHLDYGQENHYAYEALQAAHQGIKIFPIASSGLDRQGEYIFRQLAQITNGRFIFLTDPPGDQSGTQQESDLALLADGSNYNVSALDQLIVKIIEEELSYLP